MLVAILGVAAALIGFFGVLYGRRTEHVVKLEKGSESTGGGGSVDRPVTSAVAEHTHERATAAGSQRREADARPATPSAMRSAKVLVEIIFPGDKFFAKTDDRHHRDGKVIAEAKQAENVSLDSGFNITIELKPGKHSLTISYVMGFYRDSEYTTGWWNYHPHQEVTYFTVDGSAPESVLHLATAKGKGFHFV